jgi:3-oxoacyl-[acyl-carrier protein] reductase
VSPWSPFDTDRLRSNLEHHARTSGRSYDEVRAAPAAANPAGRFGVPAELGDACAYLCSAQAGFITGQNLLLDGGAYPGTL